MVADAQLALATAGLPAGRFHADAFVSSAAPAAGAGDPPANPSGDHDTMKAVILAGGLGTRISEETVNRPKPMIGIGGRPILWHIMKIYSSHGIHDFVICCGYMGYVIKEYFANYFLHMSDVTFDMTHNRMEIHERHAEPWRVTLVDTGDTPRPAGAWARAPVPGRRRGLLLHLRRRGADIDISAEHGLPSQPRQGWPPSPPSYPPARFGALEHGRQTPSARFMSRKPLWRWRHDQRRLLRAVAQGARPDRRRPPPSGNSSR
jgi:glucose-1-phosphate cytidylyltransferase